MTFEATPFSGLLDITRPTDLAAARPRWMSSETTVDLWRLKLRAVVDAEGCCSVPKTFVESFGFTKESHHKVTGQTTLMKE